MNLGHVLESFPFENSLDLLTMKGSVLWEVFENSVSRYEELAGRFLQVSGTSDIKQDIAFRT